MAYNSRLMFKYVDSYFNIQDTISFTTIFTNIRNDLRRGGLASSILINLSKQTWVVGQLKTDAETHGKLYGFGDFKIFNMKPSETGEANWPACIVDWYIFDDKWAGRTVRTIARYTGAGNTVTLKWFGTDRT